MVEEKYYKMSKTTGINKHFSRIILNINGFIYPMKIHMLADWIRKQDIHHASKKHTFPPKANTIVQ